MILVFLAISILAIIVGFILDSVVVSDSGVVIGGCGAFSFFICLAVTISLAVSVSNLSVADDKIKMYEEENTKIEQQIEIAVTTYQQHEKDIFVNAKSDSYIQLISLYPELKSDTLVESQIETYKENNAQIKKLKEKQIDGNVKRWWLYFGHKNISREEIKK